MARWRPEEYTNPETQQNPIIDFLKEKFTCCCIGDTKSTDTTNSDQTTPTT